MSRRSPYDFSERKLADFGQVLLPQEAAEPILSRPVRGALLEWIEEIWAKAILKEAGLEPRRRALFTGKPGIGKTTLAHHLSARLGLPMVCVQPDRIISKWVGASAENLGDLFDAAVKEPSPIVLFFDEFDSIGVQRGDGKSHSIDEMVNTLLQRIEAYEGLVIAATNHKQKIDPAVWRRFEIQIELELPGQEERMRILERYLAPYGLPLRSLEVLATSFETASPALIRQFAEALKRNLILGPRLGWSMDRGAVVERIIAAVTPHPECGLPALWAHGKNDVAVRSLVWPLPMAKDLPAIEQSPPVTADENIVPLRRGAP